MPERTWNSSVTNNRAAMPERIVNRFQSQLQTTEHCHHAWEDREHFCYKKQNRVAIPERIVNRFQSQLQITGHYHHAWEDIEQFYYKQQNRAVMPGRIVNRFQKPVNNRMLSPCLRGLGTFLLQTTEQSCYAWKDSEQVPKPVTNNRTLSPCLRGPEAC